MLHITIPQTEFWDEQKQEFILLKEQTLQLEHSLVSLRKWESKWNKAFLSNEQKTYEETIDYVKCMTLTQNVDPQIYRGLTDANLARINEYITAPMTATTFSDKDQKKGRQEIVTAEIIYWWMIALQIPLECQKWHLNSLLTLIRVCNIKNQPSKKRSKQDTMSRYAQLNAARRQKLNSKG